MKLHLHQNIRAIFSITLICLLFAISAFADVKQDAESEHLQLHQNQISNKYPDDMKSLDLVFEIAERYFMAGEKENADKFYLMALQKSLIIETMLKKDEEQNIKLQNKIEETVEVAEEPVSLEPDSKRIIGSKGVYTVVKGDSVRLVAAKLGVSQQQLRSMNKLDEKTYLKVGQKLAYNNRKIIPQVVRNGIIVNIPDRTLYYFERGILVKSVPIAVGSATKNEKYIWQTPLGKFKITSKIKDPTWTVPTSIQTEMEERGKEVLTTVPAGPANPLGKYAMKTSIPGILIHSTTRPSSIYSFSSHGCIRISPEQMENFFPQIRVNTSGEIIYKPVKLAVTVDGKVYLEVHRDFYNKSFDIVAEAKQLIEKQRLSDSVDWEKFKSVVKKKSGVAEDISL